MRDIDGVLHKVERTRTDSHLEGDTLYFTSGLRLTFRYKGTSGNIDSTLHKSSFVEWYQGRLSGRGVGIDTLLRSEGKDSVGVWKSYNIVETVRGVVTFRNIR